MKIICLASLFWIFSLVPAAGQEGYSDKPVKFPQYDFKFFPFRKGVFEKVLNDVYDSYNYGFDKREEIQLREKLKKTIAAFGSYKPLNPPQGVNAKLFSLTEVIKPFNDKKARLSAMLELYLFAFQEDENGKAYAAGETANWVSLYFNNPWALVGTPVLEHIYCLPLKAGKFFGYDIYNTGRGNVTVLTNSKKPLYLPVSNKEYLETMIEVLKQKRALALADGYKDDSQLSPKDSFNKGKQQRLKDFQKAYAEILKVDKSAAAEYKKTFEETEKELQAEFSSNADYSVSGKELALKGDEFYKKDLKSLTDELNSLTDEEKKKQAYYSPSAIEIRISSLSYGDVQDAEPLVKLNPDFFNTAVPQSEIQMITIIWHGVKPDEFDGNKEAFNLETWYLAELSKDKIFWQPIIGLLAK